MPVTSKKEKDLKPAQAAAHGSSIDIAFQQIRQLIVHGNLAPGTWIIEADLSRKLGMSRTPVRGALQWLQREGYVIEQKARLNSRMIVAPLTYEDARELYAIVARIEGLAGLNTASLPRPERMEVVRRIKPINDELHDIAETGKLNGRSIFDLDMRFHRAIVEAGAGPRLMLLHNAIKPQTERYWRLYASNILDQLHIAVSEHEAAVQAIRSGDTLAAEAALIANWVNGAERIAHVISQQGERGTW
ncbi:GntR family transcriptional regulator [Silvibacterium acidisoli]|uniref:GntR family transcriptional regulator n=1 Tax=Acidobacteriaceae bacterium ZG23-2 TaxID=2883246 RepID=UPI00406C1591